MQVDDTCAGTPAGALPGAHPLYRRLRIAPLGNTITHEWIQKGTTRMWFWLAENRRSLLDGFGGVESDVPLSSDRRFLEYLKSVADGEGVTVSRLLFGVPDIAEEALCLDDGTYAMTLMWALRDVPVGMLETFRGTQHKPLSKFARLAFNPKNLPLEAGYLAWRFGTLQGYALHAAGLPHLSDAAGRAEEMMQDVAVSAAVMGVPVAYAGKLVGAGFPLSRVLSSWHEGLPAEYAIAMG